MSAERPISRDDVARLLAAALGQEKSVEVVSATARALGISHADLTAAEVRVLFDRLVTLEGLVGVVARYAVSRGDVDGLIARTPTLASPKPIGRPQFRVGAAPAAPSPGRPVPPRTVDVMGLIAPALGVEKAREAIAHAAARRGVDVATGLSHGAALAVLDEMANVEGIVGVVARFAKARFLLESDK